MGCSSSKTGAAEPTPLPRFPMRFHAQPGEMKAAYKQATEEAQKRAQEAAEERAWTDYEKEYEKARKDTRAQRAPAAATATAAKASTADAHEAFLGDWHEGPIDKFTISKNQGVLLFAKERMLGSFGIRGILQPAGQWLFAYLESSDQKVTGEIRLRRQDDKVISNFKKSGESRWGTDIIYSRQAQERHSEDLVKISGDTNAQGAAGAAVFGLPTMAATDGQWVDGKYCIVSFPASMGKDTWNLMMKNPKMSTACVWTGRSGDPVEAWYPQWQKNVLHARDKGYTLIVFVDGREGKRIGTGCATEIRWMEAQKVRYQIFNIGKMACEGSMTINDLQRFSMIFNYLSSNQVDGGGFGSVSEIPGFAMDRARFRRGDFDLDQVFDAALLPGPVPGF